MSAYRLYWGDLHNHCAISYGHGSLERALAVARQQLDFCAVTGHAFWPDIPDERALPRQHIDYHVQAFAKLHAGWPQVRLGVYAAALTRESLWEAFVARRVYAVTGDKIRVGLHVNGAPMGAEIRERAAMRHVEVDVEGGDFSEAFVLHRAVPVAMARIHAVLDDTPTPGDGSMQNTGAGVDWYRLRVCQRNGQWAWSSPIWVTC